MSRLFAVLAISSLLASCSSSSNADEDKTPPPGPEIDAELAIEIDRMVEAELESAHIPGAAVVVVKNGGTIFKSGYGVEDIRTGRAVDPDRTLFRIGSVSKPMTAWALTRLADQGQVDLDDPVAKYFPGFDEAASGGGFNEPVRLWHLITHTGGFDQIGLNRHVWDWERPLDERLAMRPSITDFLKDDNLRRTSPPGTHYRYDTYGITLAGAVIENVTGKPFADAMRDTIFEPAGMTKSFVALDPQSRDDLAMGHGYVDGEVHVAPYEVYVTQPASSVDMAPGDMAKLLEAMTRDGTNTAGEVFSPETLSKMLSAQFRPHPDFPGVTHGMMETFTAYGYPVYAVRHGGSMLGFQTSLVIVPDLSLAVFVVVNRNAEAGGPRVELNGNINELVVGHFFGGEVTIPYDVPKASFSMPLTDYVGEYFYGVYCKTCTAEEFANGGWPRRDPAEVVVSGAGLSIRGDLYLATDEADVFVESGGRNKVFFARDETGRVVTFSYRSSQDVFERD